MPLPQFAGKNVISHQAVKSLDILQLGRKAYILPVSLEAVLLGSGIALFFYTSMLRKFQKV